MPAVSKPKGKAKGKAKGGKGKYSHVTFDHLCAQVEELTNWVRLLKAVGKLGSNTYPTLVKRYKPSGGGGPTQFP
jgi:hypothetical protein